jgi:hypothetical protein
MTKRISIKPEIKLQAENIRIKIIKAPLVNTEQLRSILYFRSRAVVL